MSYDVTFGYPGPNHAAEYPNDVWRNYTSNVSGMWSKALGGETLGDLIEAKGKRNADLVEPLTVAVAEMKEAPEFFREMNPSNGWGSYEGALDYLVWMLEMCRAVPDGWVEVWR